MAVSNPDPNADPNLGDFTSLPPQTQEYIKSLRSESAGYRIKAKALETQLGKLGEASSTIRKLSIDLHLTRKGDVDPQYARFLLQEENALDDLDVTADGWTELLDDRLSDLMARRPELRQQRGRAPAARSGNPLQTPGPGNPNPGGQLTRSQLAGMKPEQVTEAFKRGDLDQILGRER